MPDFFFDLPIAACGFAIILILCLFSLIGLIVVRRHLLPRLSIQVEDSEFSGAMVQAIMVFYGLAVALIAVSVWQNYSDVSKIVSQEVTTIAALYRDVTSYPDPIRSQLQTQLRDYVDQIIHHAWPLQHKGVVPTAGVEMMTQFQTTLMSFEPRTDAQKIIHAETFRAYNQMLQARRLRVDSLHTGLPGVLWVVIVLGALISLTSSFFFRVKEVSFHAIMVGLLAVFIGLIIFMIVALDHPFRGDLALQSDGYQLIYDHLMKE